MKLSDREIKFISSLLKDGKLLPEKYRSILFKNKKDIELIWEGKTSNLYDKTYSFKTIECVSGTKSNNGLETEFKNNSFKEHFNSNHWKNKLIVGDNKCVLSSLKKGPLKKIIENNGGIKLIYIDPPFDVGINFKIEKNFYKNSKIENQGNASFAYTDRWGKGKDSFLNMIYERLLLMKEILSKDGSIFFHCDYRSSSKIRLLLDEVFGKQSFVNEIIWCYRQGGRANNSYGKKHDTIFWFSKSKKHIFNPDNIRIPYEGKGGYQNSGNGVKIKGKIYKPNELGKIPEDWWDIPAIPPMSKERVGYPTQKPEKLLKRIILGSSNPNDIICDFFSGSGTTAAVCEVLGRKWICSDLSDLSIKISRDRLIKKKKLLSLQNKPHIPFEVLKLEGY